MTIENLPAADLEISGAQNHGVRVTITGVTARDLLRCCPELRAEVLDEIGEEVAMRHFGKQEARS